MEYVSLVHWEQKMNKKRIDALIPHAIKELENKLYKNGAIDKVYQGYLASFGPTVISSGLLQSVMFYSGDKNKKKVIEIMWELIKNEFSTQATSMEDFLNENQNYKNYAVKHKILEANIACKLSIRTFTLKEDSDESSM